MQVVKDRFDNDVSLGDILLHIVKSSTTLSINYVIVYGVRINKYGDVILNVYSARQYGKSKFYPIHKTHIRVDTGIVKLNKDVPEDIKKALYARIGKSL